MQPHTRRLPGMQPVAPGEWLGVDDAYAAQMAERRRLLVTMPARVLACPVETGADRDAQAAALALRDCVLAELPALGFDVHGSRVTCPDGRMVTNDLTAPLRTLGQLVQEDFCIMQRPEGGAEYLLTGAILCFPSRWTLAEKLGRTLLAIHAPVPEYDATLASRVQRLFDGVRREHPLWRANTLAYGEPRLFNPLREADDHRLPQDAPPYVRSERQTLLRLPVGDTVIFSIHTYLVAIASLSVSQADGLNAWLAGRNGPIPVR
ncbi:heme-dependent oxidative N-demethylase family protein [Roseicitreum antarcticum]|nr:DUF3445 domain-containing protein [Roseicitreum antarcticum]